MNKILLGLLLGCAAGVIDVLPMIMQKLPWSANLSAFFLWVVAGFMIATSSLQLPGVLKGLLISFMLILPVVFIVGSKNIKDLIPIVTMTLILGSLLGYFISKLG